MVGLMFIRRKTLNLLVLLNMNVARAHGAVYPYKFSCCLAFCKYKLLILNNINLIICLYRNNINYREL
jgi:hypothetical protein